MKKIYLLSLGCPRNMLDSEVLLGLLEKKGFRVIPEPNGADAAIINTCGFIEEAKQESIDLILRLSDLKKEGKIKKLIVSGCLSQRYATELTDEIEEIDGVFGSSDFTRIPDALDKLLAGEKVKEVSENPDFLYDHSYDRKLLTSKNFAYLKIQEGCSNRCSYCVIPDLKGPRRSRTIESVALEVKTLTESPILKELVIIGQDTTSFGLDRAETNGLVKLLTEISPLMKNKWIRLLYTHPAHFTDELIEVISKTDNICDYVDLPIQHISNRILKKMNRHVTKEEIINIIKKLRKNIPNVIIRTSVIVGFPGETEEEFTELVDFLEETGFDRLGAFIYSREEGTPAYDFEDQVDEDVKKERLDTIMKLQQEISSEKNENIMGKTLRVLIDEEEESEAGRYLGRAYMDAPEVDGVVFVTGEGIKPGDFVDVHITGTLEYDLIGCVVE